MQLRIYQEYAVQSVLDFDFQMGTKIPLVAAPTGVGKSLMIAGLIKRLYDLYGHVRVMVCADVKELLSQNHGVLLRLWPTAPAGIFSAGLGRKDIRPIIFGGIGSVAKCPLWFGKIDFLLVDEAHMISMKDSSQYRDFVANLKEQNPYLVVVGFTATKFRMGQGLLTEGENPLFTDICCDMTTMEAFNWFLDEGYLCRLRPVRTETEYDVTGVKTVAGEYHQGQLQDAVDKAPLTTRVIREALAMGADKEKWLVFASGVKHCVHVADEMNKQGIHTTYVHSNTKDFPMSDDERDQRIADFKAGKYMAMVNNGILTKGFDDPAIDFIVMLRKTKSIVLWIQMLGRGTRPDYAGGFDLTTKEGRLDAIKNSTKPYCLVADFAGNCRELGPINDPRIPQPKSKKTPGDAPIRICPKCGTYNHASVVYCDYCGHEFPRVLMLEVKAAKDELIRSNKGDAPVPIEVTIFDVDRVVYVPSFHVGKPPAIKVDYYCGLRKFHEYLNLESTSQSARSRSKRWWADRAKFAAPETTAEALALTDHLRIPKKVHVRLDTKISEILNYDY